MCQVIGRDISGSAAPIVLKISVVILVFFRYQVR